MKTSELKTEMGARIRKYRKRQNLSLRRLGLMIGVDCNYLSRIERGKVNATVGTLAKIAIGLDVELALLFVDEGKLMK